MVVIGRWWIDHAHIGNTYKPTSALPRAKIVLTYVYVIFDLMTCRHTRINTYTISTRSTLPSYLELHPVLLVPTLYLPQEGEGWRKRARPVGRVGMSPRAVTPMLTDA